jgi:predicted NodU family carbamoyl transferase
MDGRGVCIPTFMGVGGGGQMGSSARVNTSFNTRSKPIVCTPQDALECLFISPIDALAIGSYLIVK